MLPQFAPDMCEEFQKNFSFFTQVGYQLIFSLAHQMQLLFDGLYVRKQIINSSALITSAFDRRLPDFPNSFDCSSLSLSFQVSLCNNTTVAEGVCTLIQTTKKLSP